MLLGVGVLTGCSIDHSSDAAGLESGLAQMPGVNSVELGYEAGDLIYPGSMTVQVVMRPGAATDETLAVIDSAYREFDAIWLSRRGT
jgi:hypothetical protein